MKIIEVAQSQPTLDEVMHWAEGEVVVLRKANGTLFALTQVDDFEVEVESLRNNSEFMLFLQQLSQEEASITIHELRREMGL
jgi:hypothetical protein